jgi:mannose-6-phosphate isomerase-like protein (cupin superfamily)
MIINLASCPAEATRHGNPKQVLLRDGELPGITQVAVATFTECTETELHTHPTMYEVYFVLDGRATYRLGDASFDVEPGDFFVVRPGVIHNQRVTSAPHRIFYWGLAAPPSNTLPGC